eukprot:8476283-Alexandrium_andersonii.AAC.1
MTLAAALVAGPSPHFNFNLWGRSERRVRGQDLGLSIRRRAFENAGPLRLAPGTIPILAQLESLAQ